MFDDNQPFVNCPQGYEAPQFCWDKLKSSQLLQVDEDSIKCISKSGTGFKTILGTLWFQQGGKYYFEIFINKGSLIKIGVARPNYDTFNEAFSDTSQGWAFYNGQTRHNSNSTGSIYGTKLKSGDIIGVALDMEIGTLSFYKNGEYWGIAFKDQELRKGHLVAAVSPITVGDVFTLRNLVKQD